MKRVSTESPWLLDLQDLTVTYKQQVVLANLNLQLRAGETVAIVGPSGSGKTTLLRTLLGLLPRDSQVSFSTALFDGQPWPASEQDWHILRGEAIAFVPQDAQASLSPIKTIETQCRDVAKALSISWNEAQQRIERLLIQLDLPSSLLAKRPSALSGGMAQRVVMLLALLSQPKLIVADEPTANLDMMRQQQMVALLNEVQALTGVAIIFVTHQMELAKQIGHTLYEMKEGQLKRVLLGESKKDFTWQEQNSGQELDKRPLFAKSNSEKVHPLLAVDSVSVVHGTNERALQDISLSLYPGEWAAIIGLSGAGKSTLFNTLLGEQPIQQGTITYEGKPLHSLSKRDLGQIVQPILQNPQSSFNPRQTIGWSVGEALRRRGQTIDVAALLEEVQLPASYGARYPHELSGGECQRAAIARALSSKPQVLFCDEMTSALDETVQADIIELLCQIRDQQKLAGLVVTHDLWVAAALCDKVYVLEEGHIVESTTIAQLLVSPQSDTAKELVKAYKMLGHT